jgi:translation initiation factor IF-3
VKATVVFKGREITYKGKGEELLNRLAEQLVDVSKIDQPARLEGRSMIMILAPEKKKKAEAKPVTKPEPAEAAKPAAT